MNFFPLFGVCFICGVLPAFGVFGDPFCGVLGFDFPGVERFSFFGVGLTGVAVSGLCLIAETGGLGVAGPFLVLCGVLGLNLFCGFAGVSTATFLFGVLGAAGVDCCLKISAEVVLGVLANVSLGD